MQTKEREIVETILYSPVTNGQAEGSIENGIKLLQEYASQRAGAVTESEIDAAVKELSKQSTAPDRDTPNWMEADVRRGIMWGLKQRAGDAVVESEIESASVWCILFHDAIKDMAEGAQGAIIHAKSLLEMYDAEMIKVKDEFKNQMHEMEAEIQKEMDEWDQGKRLRAAKAIQDLRNIIITG